MPDMSELKIIRMDTKTARQLRAEENQAGQIEDQLNQLEQRHRQLQQQLAAQRQRANALLRLSTRDVDPERVENVLIPDDLDRGIVHVALSLADEDEEESE